MDIFIIGATGFVGASVARHLSNRGHRVTGLARSRTAAEYLRTNGVIPHLGDIDAGRRDVMTAVDAADAVIYAAQPDPHTEKDTVTGLVEALTGTGKTLLFTSGSGVFLQRTVGAWSPDSYAEADPFTVEPLAAGRLNAENTIRQAADHDIRTIVLRPGLIWGPGDHGHVPMIYQSVAATGAACYIGDGLNTYTNVHIDDVARLYELALTRGTAGALYHAAGGEIPNRWIAEAVAADLATKTRSLTFEEASTVWGEFGALIMAASSRSRDPRTRTELGWTPENTDMLTMIGQPRLRRMATANVHPCEPRTE